MKIRRRQFLKGAVALSAATAVGACATGNGAVTGSPAPVSTPPSTFPTTTLPLATTTTPPPPSAAGRLVVVTLGGGNDALNTVAPVADPLYSSLRGVLALDPTTTHDVGEGFALHPALTRTKELWDAERLAVVHGVGFDGLDRSHFHCMDVWHAGGEHDLTTGWLGRWLDTTGDDPLTAVAVGRRLPLLLRGRTSSGSVVPDGPFELPGDAEMRSLLAALAVEDPARPPLASVGADANADLLSVIDRVAPATASLAGGGTLDARFETVAALIEADLPTRVFAIEHVGFDTHAAQAAKHNVLLGELDAALGTFLDRMAEQPVTVLIYSEFGRRVVPNASLGTDHGGAGTILVAGHVRSGHHGDPPPLDALVDGDLATTVDFRSVYGGLLEGVLGIDASSVLTGSPTPLTLV